MELAVFVDSGLIEAFVGGRVITPLLHPSAAAGTPAARASAVVNTAGIKCEASSWQLKY